LIEWAETSLWIVAAGRGTRFYPFDAEGQPEEAFARYGFSQELVERRRFNPQMYNSFRDGSKAQIEMTSLANMTGLVPDVRGCTAFGAVADLRALAPGDGGWRARASPNWPPRSRPTDLTDADEMTRACLS
jgi:predicted homoserine dehydrogenase-like protein